MSVWFEFLAVLVACSIWIDQTERELKNTLLMKLVFARVVAARASPAGGLALFWIVLEWHGFSDRGFGFRGLMEFEDPESCLNPYAVPHDLSIFLSSSWSSSVSAKSLPSSFERPGLPASSVRRDLRGRM